MSAKMVLSMSLEEAECLYAAADRAIGLVAGDEERAAVLGPDRRRQIAGLRVLDRLREIITRDRLRRWGREGVR